MPRAGHSAGQTGGGIMPGILPYLGSKHRIARHIVRCFPPHTTYVEPFAGSASVLLAKPRSPVEVYNDLDSRVVSLFRILRSPARAELLRRACELTPFAREEYSTAPLRETGDEIEDARRFLFRSWAGFGSTGMLEKVTGFRSRDRGNRHHARIWKDWPSFVPSFAARLRGVVIEHEPAMKCIARHDSPDTLIYADPPYLHSTRKQVTHGQRGYRHEMTDDDHRALAELLHRVEGMVVLSGYPSALYDELYGRWEQRDLKATDQTRTARREILWLNPAASGALRSSRAQGELLEARA